MKIEGPTRFRRQRVRECSRVISEAVSEIEHQALEAGWTPAELAEAFAVMLKAQSFERSLKANTLMLLSSWSTA